MLDMTPQKGGHAEQAPLILDHHQGQLGFTKGLSIHLFTELGCLFLLILLLYTLSCSHVSMKTISSWIVRKLSSLLYYLFSPVGSLMASLLRQLIAGPRIKHQESNLDLCYVTPFLIATSGPSSQYPQRAYRNPLDQLVAFLDKSHGEEWCIWEFRAEGTGYPDKEVRGKVKHYPWPDHHPPPFALVPLIMAGMRNWLAEGGERHGKAVTPLDERHNKNRVVVVHCKAGKGRSGTMASAYLISECGWSKDDALARFTDRRMRPGFGQGVSIPSQVRYVDYVERWVKGGKKYVERPVQIMEIHVWGLREGVRVAIEAYIDEGKKIKMFHVFKKNERIVVEGDAPGGDGVTGWLHDIVKPAPPKAKKSKTIQFDGSTTSLSGNESTSTRASESLKNNLNDDDDEAGGSAVMFQPAEPLIIPTSDINVDFERRNKAGVGGMKMVTSVAHVWFNPFFEGNGPEQGGVPDESGIFEIEWSKMDGIKGSSRKGTRALDRLAVVWRYAGDRRHSIVIDEPAAGKDVPEMVAADWHGGNSEAPELGKELGPQKSKKDESASSEESSKESKRAETDDEADDSSLNMVKSSGPAGEDRLKVDDSAVPSRTANPQPTDDARAMTSMDVQRVLDGVADESTIQKGKTNYWSYEVYEK